jgi:hypothetical protein
MIHKEPMEVFTKIAEFNLHPQVRVFLDDYIKNYIELFQGYLKPYGLTLRVVFIKDVEKGIGGGWDE